MENYNCNQLKNIEIPEGWIENALNIPSKNNKAPAPVRLYRYAAGIAACIVIAAAVMFSTLFGINKNVKLTDPHHNPSQADNISGGTSSDTTDSTISPSGIPPALFGAESQNPTVVTEPSENNGNSASKSKQQATISSNGSTKPSSKNSEKTNNGSSGEQKATDPGNSEDETAEPMTAEPWLPHPWEEPTDEPIEPMTMGPWIEEPTTVEPWVEQGFVFTTYADASLAQEAVFCRVENQNGVILGSKGIYDLSRTTEKINVAYKDIVYLMYYCPYMLDYGNTYTVIFYNSKGIVIKQETLTVYGSDYYEIY